MPVVIRAYSKVFPCAIQEMPHTVVNLNIRKIIIYIEFPTLELDRTDTFNQALIIRFQRNEINSASSILRAAVGSICHIK